MAVVWAFERLHLYLLGQKFKCYTDNRAVQLIYSRPDSKPPARIERWALRIMNFDAEFVHKPGKTKIADYLSRHPVEGARDVYNHSEDDEYIPFVTELALPKAISKDRLIAATKDDQLLQAITKRLQGQHLSSEEEGLARSLDHVFNELCVSGDGLVLRGTRLVLLSSLQDAAERIAHDGHLGVSKTKGLMRAKVWFKNLDKLVEDLVVNCLVCKLNSRQAEHEPLKPTVMPSEPWSQLAMDIFGPLPNKNELMMVVDEMSRFPVVREVKTTAAEYVCPALHETFAMLGIPSVLKTDNGPPFNGANFGKFCAHMGIQHRKITPEHSQANGSAERFMPSLAKVVRSAKEKRDWRAALNEFLRSYRAAPHSVTGVAPNQPTPKQNK